MQPQSIRFLCSNKNGIPYGGAREKWIAIRNLIGLFGALMPSDCCKYKHYS
jgi:hypothetical protein